MDTSDPNLQTPMINKVSALTLSQPPNPYVLLPTAIVAIQGQTARRENCRAVIDLGSQLNLMSRRMVDQLAIPTFSTSQGISGIEETAQGSSSWARVRLSSLRSNFQKEIVVFILPRLTKNQPSESIDEGLSIPSTVVLADPEFGQPGSIDLLLGAEVYSRLIRPGLIGLGDDKPTLQETTLGWIVFGAVRRRVPAAMAGNVMTITREDPLPALEKFWKLDTFNTEVPAMTVQERLCEEHFLSNVQICPDQRLMV
ncbi:uncharacterized protein [Drosophila suzukii]|uniref:Peptidase aspartic putative domain-containing protein n=1 Tax=Drosophila suzukii TaxID=28584 RepID=A0ABM4TW55_DROSZ